MRYLSLILALLCLLPIYYLHDPLFLALRQHGSVALVCIAVLGLLSAGFKRGTYRKLVVASWSMVLLLTCQQNWQTTQQQHQIQQLSSTQHRQLQQLGQHLVIGYDQAEDIKTLVARGYIAGIFVTTRNIRGKSAAQFRAEIAQLQNLRHAAGLAPLLVTTDQEGGAVSRLSPLVAQQATLSSLLRQHAQLEQIEQAAEAYGRQQGRALAALGVNTNFSPVVDLKPARPASKLDWHTRIAERAISDNPEVVRRVALAYNRGLYQQGVMPTLKHFPGLGKVSADTHLGSAHLDLASQELNRSDWYPFRTLLQQGPAMLMIGHVTLTQIDRHNPATLSPAVLQGIIRQQWGFQGKLISDDMSMGAVYQRGICRASQQALAAGIDYLLISYDWRLVYQIFDCHLSTSL